MRDRCFIYLYIFFVYIHKHIVNDNRLNFMANYLQYSMWVVTINRGLSTVDNRDFRDDNFVNNSKNSHASEIHPEIMEASPK